MSEAWNSLVNGLRDALVTVGAALGVWIPRIVVALLILVIGRWILGSMRKWLTRLLELPPVQTVFDKAGVSDALRPSGRKASTLLATVGHAFLLLLLWLIVFRVLEIEPITNLLERLIAVLPMIFIAVVLVIIASAIGNFVAELVRPFAEQRAIGWLPTAAKTLVVIIGALAALDLLEIRFAEDIVKIFAAATGIAFAVAFGVGGIETARQWWSRYLAPRS